jgi:hypothetical protein
MHYNIISHVFWVVGSQIIFLYHFCVFLCFTFSNRMCYLIRINTFCNNGHPPNLHQPFSPSVQGEWGRVGPWKNGWRTFFRNIRQLQHAGCRRLEGQSKGPPLVFLPQSFLKASPVSLIIGLVSKKHSSRCYFPQENVVQGPRAKGACCHCCLPSLPHLIHRMLPTQVSQVIL